MNFTNLLCFQTILQKHISQLISKNCFKQAFPWFLFCIFSYLCRLVKKLHKFEVIGGGNNTHVLCSTGGVNVCHIRFPGSETLTGGPTHRRPQVPAEPLCLLVLQWDPSPSRGLKKQLLFRTGVDHQHLAWKSLVKCCGARNMNWMRDLVNNCRIKF